MHKVVTLIIFYLYYMTLPAPKLSSEARNCGARNIGKKLTNFIWQRRDREAGTLSQINRSTLPTWQNRARLGLSLGLAGFFGVIYACSSSILLSSIQQAEIHDCRQIVKGVLGVLNQAQEDVDARFADWAAYDESYQFIVDGNQRYIDAGLAPEVLSLTKVSLVLYIDTSGRLVYGTGFDYRHKKYKPIPDEIRKHLHLNDLLLKHKEPQSKVVGIIALPEGPMIISSRPIVTSKGTGPIRGTFIVGRYLNSDGVDKISKATRALMSAYSINDDRMPTDFKAVRSSLKQNEEILVRHLNQQVVGGYVLINDIYGKPAVLIGVNIPRIIYQQGQSNLRYLTSVLILVGIAFFALTLGLVNKLIFVWKERQEREERYRAVIIQASEGIFLVDAVSRRILEVNPAFKNLLNYSDEEIQLLNFDDVVTERRIRNNSIYQDIQIQQHHFNGESKYRRKDGSLIDVEVSANLIPYNKEKAFCIVIRDITERKGAEAALKESESRLYWQATHDSLTQLANRLEFERLVKDVIDSSNSLAQHALLYLDLDQFKFINDTCGHSAGDELLCQVSILFQSEVRKTDIVARLGGDEFGILLYDCLIDKAAQIANSIREQVNKFRFAWEKKSFSISVSIGLVSVNTTGENYTDILSAADVACYFAKNSGRNRIHIYQLNDCELERQRGEMKWVSKIPIALEENRFCLYYQKIVPLDSAQTRKEHYEILLRLIDEVGNIVMPMAFIPAAERYNLMPLIDCWVISTLFEYLSELNQYPFQPQINDKIYTVNLSGTSLNSDTFVAFIKEQFVKHQVEPSQICFEITETMAVANLTKTSALIQEIKTLGCHFALDDFGSGMSSFAYLKNLSVDYLKLDGHFIKNIVNDKVAAEMVEAIARIASVMEIETIAEFVEDDATLKKVKTLGVHYAQGYEIGKPSPLESIGGVLKL
jgi:diguanylate cyclase (GGDEF)-like protein/PAS domain S-box-containing protein